jgi:RNA polymerase primary sigma factor/RNA polymerase sigma factor
VVEYLRVFCHVGFFVFKDLGSSQPGGGIAMHTDYLSAAIRQLRDRQVRFAPYEKQIQQADSAEKLLNELDPKRTYTCEYVCHRVTNNGYESDPDLMFTGKEARHDLRLFVEDLSEAARVPASAAGERVLTIDELARQFCVSAKTVSRWRQQGLVCRRFLLDGCKRVGFLQSSVDRFVAQNEERIHRAAQFRQLTNEERKRIVERAGCLTQAGGCLTDVTKRIAQETGHSVETIRYTLRRFDQDHSAMALLSDRHRPRRPETRSRVYQQYRRGESVAVLAQRFHRSQSHIYRIINDMRAAQIMELPLDYIGNEQFARLRPQKKEGKILGPLPESNPPTKKPRVPKNVPAYLASLYEIPLLTREQEVHLFRKMNYLKYKASALRAQLDLDRPKSRPMDRIEKLHDEAVATRNQIIRANLRLVVSIAKRRVGPGGTFFELVSDGNMSLIRAAEKFDFSGGNRFSTYASWALMKNFAHTIPAMLRQQDRFCTSHSEIFSYTEDVNEDSYLQESAQIRRESQVARILGQLDERERQIVTSRFGLTDGQEPLTLKQVGAAIGVTKERIRQIQVRAMSKLREASEEAHIE